MGQNFVKIALSVSEINSFLCLTQKIKMAAKSGRKTFFCKIMLIDSADTLWVKNFAEIALSRSVSEINTFLQFTQKFKIAVQSGRKMIFVKSCKIMLIDSADTLWVKNFVKIDPSRSVSEINVFLQLRQKFTMAAKRGRKTIFGESCQKTLQIPCGSKIVSKSLYLTPFPR